MVALLERLAVEEAGELGERLGVVVDRDRHVLLVRGVLVADLLVELGDEGFGGHRSGSILAATLALGRPNGGATLPAG